MQHLKAKRSWWFILGRRRCICGLPWPCIEAYVEECRRREEGRITTALTAPMPMTNTGVKPIPPTGCVPTMPLFQVTRAGGLTPAQEHHAGRESPC